MNEFSEGGASVFKAERMYELAKQQYPQLAHQDLLRMAVRAGKLRGQMVNELESRLKKSGMIREDVKTEEASDATAGAEGIEREGVVEAAETKEEIHDMAALEKGLALYAKYRMKGKPGSAAFADATVGVDMRDMKRFRELSRKVDDLYAPKPVSEPEVTPPKEAHNAASAEKAGDSDEIATPISEEIFKKGKKKTKPRGANSKEPSAEISDSDWQGKRVDKLTTLFKKAPTFVKVAGREIPYWSEVLPDGSTIIFDSPHENAVGAFALRLAPNGKYRVEGRNNVYLGLNPATKKLEQVEAPPKSGTPEDTDDTEVAVERMTEEELLKGLVGLQPPEELSEDEERAKQLATAFAAREIYWFFHHDEAVAEHLRMTDKLKTSEGRSLFDKTLREFGWNFGAPEDDEVKDEEVVNEVTNEGMVNWETITTRVAQYAALRQGGERVGAAYAQAAENLSIASKREFDKQIRNIDKNVPDAIMDRVIANFDAGILAPAAGSRDGGASSAHAERADENSSPRDLRDLEREDSQMRGGDRAGRRNNRRANREEVPLSHEDTTPRTAADLDRENGEIFRSERRGTRESQPAHKESKPKKQSIQVVGGYNPDEGPEL